MALLWWHWLALGFVLIAIELLGSGGFYVIFFGVAALVIGILSLGGVLGSAWVELLLFSVLSVVSLAVFRRPVMRWMDLDRPATDVDSLVGETAIVLDDIGPGGVGRAEMRGAVWSARNDGRAPLAKGQRCTVARVDRLTLFIVPEGAPA